MNNHYTRFLEKEHAPETFVRLALAMTERDLREIALLALSEWSEIDVISIALYQNIASLRSPSYGTWNGLINALRKLRRQYLQNGTASVRNKIEKSTYLTNLFSILDERIANTELKESFEPLFKKVNFNKGKKLTLKQILVIPITLRNIINHDSPTTEIFWKETALFLRPFIQWLSQQSALIELCTTATHSSPWFLEKEEELLTFNGIDRNFDSIYITKSNTYYLQEPTSKILLTFQKLLGKTVVQEKNFVRWLTQMAPDSIKGVKMGDYLVGKVVGEGGHGRVHQGMQLSTGRRVAIKILRDGLVEEDDNRLRFEQEAIFLSSFSHPNIVTLISHGEDTWSAPSQINLDNETWYQAFKKSSRIKYFIVLEWIQGETLEYYFKQSEYINERLLQWFIEAVEALETVHQAGLVHRDVKPSNMMITEDGVLKLMDFGIARSAHQDRSYQTPTGVHLGTQAYMSPEQIRSNNLEAMVGPSSDIYSLCSVFYELYTKQRLFNHDQLEPKTVEGKKLSGERPIGKRNNKKILSWELQTILGGGLELEPSDRYKSMKDLKTDLLHFTNDEPIAYKKPSILRRVQLFYRRYKVPIRVALVSTLILFLSTLIYLYNIKKERDEVKHHLGLALNEKLQQALKEKNFNTAKILSANSVSYLKKESSAIKFAQESFDTSIISPLIYTQKLNIEPKKDNRGSGGIVFSPNAKAFVLISEDEMELLNTITGNHILNFNIQADDISTINTGKAKFSHDSKYLATSHSQTSFESQDTIQIIKIWDVKEGNVLSTIKFKSTFTINSFIFYPNDSQRIIVDATEQSCASSINLGVWNISSSSQVDTIRSTPYKNKGVQPCLSTIDLINNNKQVIGMYSTRDQLVLYNFTSKSFSQSIPYTLDKKYYLSPNTKEVAVISKKPENSKQKAIAIYNLVEGNNSPRSTCNINSDNASIIRFSPNSKYIAASYLDKNLNKIDICSIEEAQIVNSFYTHRIKPKNQRMHSGLFEFHPDSNELMTISSEKAILQLWDINIKRGYQQVEFEDPYKLEPESRIIFSPNGKEFTIISKILEEKTDIYRLDSISGKVIKRYNTLSRFTSFHYDTKNKPVFLTSMDSKNIILLSQEINPDTTALTIPKPVGLANVTLANNAKYYVVANSKNSITIWNSITHKKLHSLTIGLGLEYSIDSTLKIKFSPNNEIMFVTSAHTNKFELWDVKRGKKIQSLLLAKDVIDITFSNNGKFLLVVHKDGIVDIEQWEIKSGQDEIYISSKQELDLYKHRYSRSSDDLLALYPNDLLLAYTYNQEIEYSKNKYIKIRDLYSGKDITTLSGNFSEIIAIDFSPDHTKFVAIVKTQDNKTKTIIWDATAFNDGKRNGNDINKIEQQTNLVLNGVTIEANSLKNTNVPAQWNKGHINYWIPKAASRDANAKLQLGIVLDQNDKNKEALQQYQQSATANNNKAQERIFFLENWLSTQ